MAGGRPHTSSAVAVGGTSRAGMRSQIVSRPVVRMGPGWAAALDPRRQPKQPDADRAVVGLALSSLTDDFSDNAVDPAVWPNSFGTYSETGGRARVQCDTGYNAYSSALAYRLAESQASLRVFPPTAGGAATDAWCQVLIKSSTAGTDLAFEINAVSGLLRCLNRTGYFDATPTEITYDPLAHAWLRVRETGGTTYWETSPDSVVWTTRRILTSPAWAGDGNIEFQLIAHRDSGTTDFAEFDNVNIIHIKEPFDSYSTASTWAEGSIQGPWQVEFLGNSGQVVPVDVTGEGRVLQLEAVDQASTSSSLVVSTPRTVGDVHWQSRLRTVAQLHTTPNPWEVVWFVWNYDEPSPTARRYYYVALKTNGFELGKVDQSIGLGGGQRFLWTDSTVFTVGTWYTLEVRQDGARIRVWIDGTLRADFTDGPGSGGTPSWGTEGEIVMTAGSVGMYHEDARVQFGNVLWVDEVSGDAGLAATSMQAADGTTGSVTGDASTACTAILAAAGTAAVASDGSLSATCSVTAAGSNAAVGTVSATATATVTAAGSYGAAGTGALTGSVSISADGINAAVGSADSTATASVSAALTADYTGAATAPATAAVVADGVADHAGDVSGAGTATLDASATVDHPATASAEAIVAIAAQGALQIGGSGLVEVAATPAATAVVEAVGDAADAVTATATAAGGVGRALDAAAAANADLTVAGTVAAFGDGGITATAGLSAAAVVAHSGDAALAASASLIASSTPLVTGTASLDTAATENAAGTVQVTAGAAVAATATVSGSGVADHSAVATADATAAVNADGLIAATADAGLAGNVATAAQAAVTTNAAGTVAATMLATAAGIRGASTGAALAAAATLIGSGTRGVQSGTSMGAQTALTAAAQLDLATGGTLASTVALTASGTLTIAHEDVDITVGAPYVSWTVGNPQGASYGSGLAADGWQIGNLYSTPYQPAAPATDWEVAAP